MSGNNNSNSGDNDLLRTIEAAKYLHVSRRTFLEWAKRHKIPNESITRSGLYRRSEIDKVVARLRTEKDEKENGAS